MNARPEIGRQLGAYRIDGILGRGGMGVVYRASAVHGGETVALKVLAPEIAADAAFRARFEREARAAAEIEHPNVVPVVGSGEDDGHVWIAMRLVEGHDLAHVLRTSERLAPAFVVSVVGQVAAGLDAAHARGMIHRDVKPGNVLLAADNGAGAPRAFLTDFGLTRGIGSERLTRTGQFVGTVDYVAPEQIRGDPPAAAADVYALGCMTYELLAGTPPFVRTDEVRVLFAHLSEDPPPLSEARSDVPAAVDAVIARAMAKETTDRHQTCTAFATELAEAFGDLGEAASPPAEAPGRAPAAGAGSEPPARPLAPQTEQAGPIPLSAFLPPEETPRPKRRRLPWQRR